MPSYTLEWRQFLGEGVEPAFLHRLVAVRSPAEVVRSAAALGDRAWRREFRVALGGSEVYTTQHEIARWDPAVEGLPGRSPMHVWLEDLRRDLVADRFLDAVGRAVVPAVSAGVLPRADADALLRFARRSLLRPRI